MRSRTSSLGYSSASPSYSPVIIMTVYVGPFFKHSKFCLIVFGLWPHQSTISKRINNCFFGLFAISAMTPMALGLRQESSTDVVIFSETMSSTIMIFGGLVQTTILYLRRALVKTLFEKIHSDWSKITDEEEVAILGKFFLRGKTLAVFYMVSSISAYFLFMILTYAPMFFDKNTPRDKSQFFPYYSNQWIISENSFRLQLFIHGSLGILLGTITYVIVMTTYICCVTHVCGMYAIVGHRLRNLMKSQNDVLLIKDNEIVRKLLSIVAKHRETIEGTQMIGELFGTAFFIVESCLIICIGLLIFDIKYNINNIRLVLKILLIVMSFIIFIFQVNYGGEEVIQFSNRIHLSIYSVQWYLTSKEAKRILLMILQRSYRPDVLIACIMKLSLANFVTILKASWSLATILLGETSSNVHQMPVIAFNKTR